MVVADHHNSGRNCGGGRRSVDHDHRHPGGQGAGHPRLGVLDGHARAGFEAQQCGRLEVGLRIRFGVGDLIRADEPVDHRVDLQRIDDVPKIVTGTVARDGDPGAGSVQAADQVDDPDHRFELIDHVPEVLLPALVRHCRVVAGALDDARDLVEHRHADQVVEVLGTQRDADGRSPLAGGPGVQRFTVDQDAVAVQDDAGRWGAGPTTRRRQGVGQSSSLSGLRNSSCMSASTRAPSAPSMGRWSMVRPTVTPRRAVSPPRTTIGRSEMAPADREVACGGVSRLVNEGTPKPPRLDRVVVPPCRSAPVSLPARARAMVARISASCSSMGSRSGSRMTGASSPMAVSAASATPTLSLTAAGALAASSHPAFTCGYARIARARARISRVDQPIRRRTRPAASRSNSANTVHWGTVALATMVRATADRIALRRGASASANAGSPSAAGAAAAGAGAAGGLGAATGVAAGVTGAAAAAGLAEPLLLPASSTSSTVITPPGPVARTSSSDTLSSAARRRASGTAGSGPLRLTGVAALGARAAPVRSCQVGATSDPGVAG